MATDNGLIIFCWGDDNNSKDTIKHLKSLGIHAIIYDKMDIFSDKAVKVSEILSICFLDLMCVFGFCHNVISVTFNFNVCFL